MGLKGDVSMGPEKIRDKMIEAHLPLIDKAGAAGVQVLCFQEIFTQPYFCPSQDRKWYAAAEAVPDGYTTKLMQEYAKKYRMVMVVPVYEEAMTGVYYNTAAVIDADGKYLGKYRKTHIPQVDPGFYEKFFFKPGDLGYPVFQTAYVKLGVYICYDRHFPEGWRALALNGAEYIVNPSATVAGSPNICGSSSSPPPPPRTVCSSARSIASARKRPGPRRWASSTAPATSSIRAARSKPRRVTTKTNC